MIEPVKLLYLFKNVNNIRQAVLYVFVGPVQKQLLLILQSLDQSDLQSCLSKKKRGSKYFEEYYGKRWYQYFLPAEHLENEKVKAKSASKDQQQEAVKMTRMMRIKKMTRVMRIKKMRTLLAIVSLKISIS